MIDLSLHKTCFDIDSKKDGIVICKDLYNTSKYTLNNKSSFEISKIKIDNCVFKTKDGFKCDYLLKSVKHNKTEHLYLIELKGKQILKAVAQIDETLKKLNITNKSAKQVFGRIVPTGSYSPDTRSKEFKKLDEKFRKLNGNLKCQTKNEDTI